MIDFHAHILPGIDDGARTVEESLGILRESAKQGVKAIVATPHFYPGRISVSDFLHHRQKAYDRLLEKTQGEELPPVYLGAEVALSVDLFSTEDWQELCLEGGKYMLLEMPYQVWTPGVYEAVYRIIARFGITPILAHLERYAKKPGKLIGFEELLQMNTLVQVNADSVLRFGSSRTVHALWKAGRVDLLGSDVHSLKGRATHMQEAWKKLSSKYGKDNVSRLTENAQRILQM